MEAGIASLYASSKDWAAIDWQSIVNYYRQLQALTDSPIVTINASIAETFLGHPEQALSTLDQLRSHSSLQSYAPYYIARAEVLRQLNRPEEAANCLNLAIQHGASVPVIEHLENRLAALQ